MKLRIKGNSLRLRLLRSEVDRLEKGHCVEEVIHLGSDPFAKLGYSLCVRSQREPIEVEYLPPQLCVYLSLEACAQWFNEHEIGVSTHLTMTDGNTLSVLIEKDFACLDASEEENKDTFANPLASTC